ncbi:uracil phosphoribosyltransferase [Marivirga sericea]|uniref:Uracil phosphoribosyltransferase n=1 Tax=Marivirga sericea TaxID=1028 RepID=A0A1X7KP62_9BACT|nr:uracil phosphoribosyltransferase [Marivirga sericea]SMG43320.1 uracil phosphoribosyltransferase [Marivirga sericea]
MYILDKENSIANHFLAELREIDIQKDRYRFRRNLERIAELLAYEISKTLYFQNKEIQTPLEKTSVALMHDFPVIVSVLRAGLPFHQGFLNIFDHSDSGFIGAFRQHGEGDEFEIAMGYEALPPISGRTVILADPMLATGKSLIKAVNHISKIGKPEKFIIASAIGTPEGIQNIEEQLELDLDIYLGSLDRELNEKAYILPGLGDAGDLSYGQKHTH